MILMNDFTRTEVALREAQIEAFTRVVDSGWMVLGPEVRAFEQAFAKASNAGQAIGVGNGLDAIEIILRALDIGPGDEVITTGMTAIATALGILRAGATPVFADIFPGTGQIDPASVARCITSRTRAVLPVHLYGNLADVDALTDLCGSHDLYLVEDCAQAHLAQQGGTVAGSFGIAGAYSFYPTKNLGAIGDAGAIVTANADLTERARRLRNYGQSERYHHPELGMNSRLDEVQAALLLARLPYLSGWTERRRSIAQIYRTEFNNGRIRLPEPTIDPSAHAYHLFVIACDERDRLQEHLEHCGVQSLIHYPIPAHLQPPTAEMPRDPRGLPGTEAHAATCLSLPCHPYMTEGEVQKVVDSINSFIDG